MLAKDLISDVIVPLQPSDTGIKGLHWMEVFRISHLPIVDQGDLLGLISDMDIFDRNMMDLPISEYFTKTFSPFAYDYQHLYEVIELFSHYDLTAIPVLNEQHKYLGIISLRGLVQYLGDMASVKVPGGIIVLELNVHDYSLSEIARIIEGNDAKILSCYISSLPDSVKMEVILKINQTDLTSIIQTFLRYDYTIKASYKSSDNNEEVLRNNYDLLMMYLNV